MEAGSCNRGHKPASLLPPVHHSTFAANWICLDVVEVLVITPAVGETPEGVNTTRFGVLKFVWLRMLKNSARSCNRMCSSSAVSLNME